MERLSSTLKPLGRLPMTASAMKLLFRLAEPKLSHRLLSPCDTAIFSMLPSSRRWYLEQHLH